ncbi:substrate-binding domain-containing protein [Pedobacter aquae]|uniref:histidine kinase n=1 Tax=Pedobacter aquae TaxID=2605747 RepID=A0A5C0VNJ9_9SPHI|nr:substrate-binding domain-containing protein [Pedobacter aquae]QEK53111.1 substrate-binding domain-containing protein [Pedobacter aquae]
MNISYLYLFNKKTITLLSFLLLLTTSCFQSKSPGSREEYVIGFSQCVGSDQWRKTMLDEVKRELSFESGITLYYEDADNDSRRQIEQVKSLLARKIDLLIISPNEANPLTPVVEEVFKKGIPVVVIDRKTNSNLYTAYVGADNYEIGKMAGEYLANRLNRTGKIWEVMGLPGSSPAIERQRGFYDAIKKFPNVKITEQVYGNWLLDKAEKEVLNIKSKDVDAIFAHNDQMALGAYNALKSNKLEKSVKIIGVDALPNGGQKFVGDGIISASMLYPTGGKEAIRTSLAILKKESFEKENILKSVVIDATNVQLMKMQIEKMDNQQEDIERQQNMLSEQNKIYKDQQFILNVLIISLVLALIFGGIAFLALSENWKSNKKLETKNHEIIAQQEELIKMSAQAKVASEAKFNFFTNISHEFRTPLTLIISPLEELIADTSVPPAVSNSLKLINRNVVRLLRLVNQLIEFRKIEYDGMKIKPSKNNITVFCKDIIYAFKDIAQKRNIELKFKSTVNDLEVWFDVNMLDKVLFNLLSNAFKFTNSGDKIKVTIELENDEFIKIVVQDTGLGMAEDDSKHAFELFYQGKTHQTKGSGLGLTLSKEIVELHKGKILVNSQLGLGTTFTVMLPTGDKHFNIDETYSYQTDKTTNYDDIKIYTTELENIAISSSETHKKEDNIAPHEFSILIIEDNDDLRNFLAQKLSSEYEVYAVSDGLQGIREAFDQVPDLIISDVVLPNKSGTEIVQTLKNDMRTSHIPIVLLTAKGSIEQRIEGIETMADAYITKPFNLQHLKASVKNLLFNRNLLKTRFTTEIATDNRHNVTNKLDKKFLSEFASIVESNIANEKFNVDDICKQIGISRVQLYRKVKALMDTNITDYILNRRLQRAKYLLLNEDLTIAEITYQVGFASPTYFSTVFKTQNGCTPSEYKKNKSDLLG